MASAFPWSTLSIKLFDKLIVEKNNVLEKKILEFVQIKLIDKSSKEYRKLHVTILSPMYFLIRMNMCKVSKIGTILSKLENIGSFYTVVGKLEEFYLLSFHKLCLVEQPCCFNVQVNESSIFRSFCELDKTWGKFVRNV